MSPSELEELFEEHPDKPVRFTLASGDVIHLRSPAEAVINNLSLIVLTVVDPVRRTGGWRAISIPNIVLAESTESLPPPGQGRRGRRKR